MRAKNGDKKKRDRNVPVAERKSSKKTKGSVRTTESQNRRFLDLVQGLDTIVWEADATTWQFTFVNQRAEKILGYPVEQWLTEPDFWAKHIHPEDRQEAVAYCRSATLQGKDHEFEYRAVAADGRVVWLRDIVHVVKDHQGQVHQLRGVMVDITERKRAEKAVQESEARSRGILDSALDCIITMNHQGMIVEFNPAAEKTFGYKRDEVIGKSMAELLVPPSLRERHYRGLAHYLATGEGPVLGKRVEMMAMRADGSEFPVELAVTRLALDGPPMFTGYIRDVTKRKRAEEDLQHHLERIRALQDINLAITSTLDLRAVLQVLFEKIDLFLPYAAVTVRLLNPETRELEPTACWNIDEQEWKATTAVGGGLGRMLAEDNLPVMVRNAQADPRSLAADFLRKHGLVSYLRVPLTAKGQVLGVLTFFTREAHEFKDDEVGFLTIVASQAAIAIYNSRLHEQTKKQTGQLEKANNVKDEFLGFVSHELRTPVNAIMGYTDMIKDRILGEINPQQERLLAKVLARSKNLLGMINGLLEASKMEAGGVKVALKKVDLADFLGELRSTYDIPLDKELTLTWDYPSDLPVTKTDREKLRHILENLINNAIKFTEKGSVSVSARHLPESKKVAFKVADTGIGISEKSMPFIFEMFRQADDANTRSLGGVGLGLHIVKKFTEMLDGSIEVESRLGRGSTFTVTIPHSS